MADTLTKELIKEICSTGDKTSTIPATTESGSNSLSYAEGFPIATATPQSDGGIPPKRTDMNKVLNVLSKNQVFLQNGGAYAYDSTIATAIGGYPLGARLLYTDRSGNENIEVSSRKYYIESLKNNNTDEPTKENVYVVQTKIVSMQIIATSSELPSTPTDPSQATYVFCLENGYTYIWSTTQQSWLHTTLFTNNVVSNLEGTSFYIKSGNDWINLATQYSWIEYPVIAGDFIVKISTSGTSWYKLYSNGWIEQGGRTSGGGSGDYTVTFSKEMKDTNYNMTFTPVNTNGASGSTNNYIKEYSTTSMKISLGQPTTFCSWRVEGYIK